MFVLVSWAGGAAGIDTKAGNIVLGRHGSLDVESAVFVGYRRQVARLEFAVGNVWHMHLDFAPGL